MGMETPDVTSLTSEKNAYRRGASTRTGSPRYMPPHRGIPPFKRFNSRPPGTARQQASPTRLRTDSTCALLPPRPSPSPSRGTPVVVERRVGHAAA